MTRKRIQWHPTFYAGLQIELKDEADKLLFCNEYPLGTKPKQIDVLVIKKTSDEKICKNIGRIFRGHNLFEYKSPEDTFSIDDFYQLYGYACFYKADTGGTDAVKDNDITITIATTAYPVKLMKELRKKPGFEIQKIQSGIYYVDGGIFPIQILVIKQLCPEENLWLSSLKLKISDLKVIEKLAEEYEINKDNRLYSSVMDTLVRLNNSDFEEAKDMCEALRELWKDDIEKANEEGRIEGKIEGENHLSSLIKKIIEVNPQSDLKPILDDSEYRKTLYQKYGIV